MENWKKACMRSGYLFENIVEEVLARDGLAIPAHIDRPSNSVLSNLGFLPELRYSALEAMRKPLVCETWGNTFIQGSDAHMIDKSAAAPVLSKAQVGISKG